MMRFTTASAFVLIISTTVTFYSCEQVDRGTEARIPKGEISLGGAISVATTNLPIGFLPKDIETAASSEIGLHLHACLLMLDPNSLEVIPGLAESWSVDENGTSYVFNLRKGAKFHADECFGRSSREITAHDFKFSFEQLCKNEVGSAFETSFRNRVEGSNAFHDGEANEISGVTVIDDYTLKIELMKPDETFLFVLAHPTTAVISEKALAKYGNNCTIGAGPFRLGSREDALTLVRNPEYFLSDEFGNQFPYIDTLKVSVFDNKQAQLEAFFSGELDIVSGLYLDPVRTILETQVASFSGKNPKYIMQRESESIGYETYVIYRSNMTGLGNNFMGYRDFSRVQIQQ